MTFFLSFPLLASFSPNKARVFQLHCADYTKNGTRFQPVAGDKWNWEKGFKNSIHKKVRICDEKHLYSGSRKEFPITFKDLLILNIVLKSDWIFSLAYENKSMTWIVTFLKEF